MTGSRQEWEPMVLHEVGDIDELVLVSQGGGKTAVVEGDPGEPMKVPAQE